MSSGASLKEVNVSQYDRIKKVIFLIKQELLKESKINIVAGTLSAGAASGAAETLKRLGYIEYEDIKTETVIENGSRRIKFVITAKKTNNFDTLYKQYEEQIKKVKEEREKQKGAAQ